MRTRSGSCWAAAVEEPRPCPLDGAPTTLVVSGPAAHLSGAFNMNGIDATSDGKTLFVAHSGDGTIYRVDPGTGVSLPIAGADVPNVDGILFEANRMWAVQNFSNQVTA